MYTGLRAKVVVKLEYHKAITLLYGVRTAPGGGLNCWKTVAEWFPFFQSWGEVGRASFIPFGVMCYMPEEWGETRSKFDRSTGVWEFHCSLKNYEGEIEKFLSEILSEISESVEFCQTLYEEDESETDWTIETMKSIS